MKRFGPSVCRMAVKIIVTVLLLAIASHSGAMGAAPPPHPLLLAHYMPWFEAKPASHQWGMALDDERF